MTKKNVPKIHFIMTGGTIDSYFNGMEDKMMPNTTSVIPQYIESIRPYIDCEFTLVSLKDSRDINSSDQEKILKVIKASHDTHFIVTHGNYTLTDTARFLEEKLASNPDVTVVLCGALTPIGDFAFSDGPFNLGFAVSQVQTLEPGVYVCMNANTFKPKESVRLISEGRYGSL